MLEFPWQWACAYGAAICIGMSKAGFGGISMIAILLMAKMLPARESTGAVLPLLIFADLFAVRAFRKFAVRRHLLLLLPPAVLGILAGWLAMPHLPAGSFRALIGWIIIALVALAAVQKLSPRLVAGAAEHPTVAWMLGCLAGVTTMLANAAGPVMSIYLLACRLPKYEFVGTAAWFFFVVNIMKVPFSASLGLISGPSLWLNLALAPGVLAGVFAGKTLLQKINQGIFDPSSTL